LKSHAFAGLRSDLLALIVAALGLAAAFAPSSALAAGCTPSGPYATLITGTSGLVSYWRLGDRSGTAACDAKGVNAGKYSGTFTFAQAGAISGDTDTAVKFGSLGNVAVTSSTSLNPTRLSIEAWVKPVSISAGGAIISKGQQYLLEQRADGSLRFTIWLAGVSSPVQVSSPPIMKAGAFQHVAATFDGQSAVLYRNGVPLASSAAVGSLASTANKLTLASADTTSYFGGTVDEAAIYSAALTGAQVEARYDKGVAGVNPPPAAPAGLSANASSGAVQLAWAAVSDDDLAGYQIFRRQSDGTYPPTPTGAVGPTATSWTDQPLYNDRPYTYLVKAVDGKGQVSPASAEVSATPTTACPATGPYGRLVSLESGLNAFWELDEPTGASTVCDGKGPNTGTLVGSVSLGGVGAISGEGGGSASFAGANSEITIRGDAASVGLNPTTSIGLEAWVKPTSISGIRPFVSKAGQYQLRLNNGALELVMTWADGTSQTLSSAAVVTANAWQHVVATYDGSTLVVYRNGLPVSTTAVTKTMANSSSPLRLGTDGTAWFGGQEDEVGIYGAPLTASTVSQHFDHGSKTPPTVSIGGLGSQWLDSSTVLHIAADDASADQRGTGVASLETSLDGTTLDSAQQTCSSPGCSLARDVTLAGDTLADGNHTLSVVAKDFADNTTRIDRAVGIDRAEPEVSVSGSLLDHQDLPLDDVSYSLDVDATDGSAQAPASGVQSIEFFLNDTSAQSQAQPCPNGSCAMTATYTVNAAGLADGSYDLVAVVTDQAGHATQRHVPFYVDRAAPRLAVSGSAFDARDHRWLTASSYDLSVSATYPAGVTGLDQTARLEIAVDGQDVTDRTVTCPSSGCGASEDYTLNTDALGDGTHLVHVIATDWGGRVTQKAWTILVDRTAPRVVLSGSLATGANPLAYDEDYDLHAVASDAGAGVDSLTISLDGAAVRSVTTPCADGGCRAEADWTVIPGTLQPGSHTLTVTARAGSQQTDTAVTFLVPTPPASQEPDYVLFRSGSNLDIARPDGTSRETVWRPWDCPESSCYPNAFALSPDGTQVGVETSRDSIWLVDNHGNAPHQVISVPRLVAGSLSFTPDGQQLLFEKLVDAPEGMRAEVWSVGIDGSDLTPVAQTEHATYLSFGVSATDTVAMDNLWGPGFATTDTSGSDLAQVALPALGPQRPLHVALSADGQTVAASCANGGYAELCSFHTDGTNFRYLTADHATEVLAPHWSGDGRWISYVAYRNGIYQTVRVPAYGGPPQPYLTSLQVGPNGFVTAQPSQPEVSTELSNTSSDRDDIYASGSEDQPVTVTAGDAGGIQSLHIREVGGTFSDASGVSCSPTCPPEAAADFVIPTSAMTEGLHSFSATASNASGISGAAKWAVLVDRGAPSVPSAIVMDGMTNTNTASISWRGGEDPDLATGEPGVGGVRTRIRYQVDGGAWSDWSSVDDESLEVPGASVGSQISIAASSVDALGNESQVVAPILSVSNASSSPVDIIVGDYDPNDASTRGLFGPPTPRCFMGRESWKPTLEDRDGEPNVMIVGHAWFACPDARGLAVRQVRLKICIQWKGWNDDWRTIYCDPRHKDGYWERLDFRAETLCRPGEHRYRVKAYGTLDFPAWPDRHATLTSNASDPLNCNEAGAWRYQAKTDGHVLRSGMKARGGPPTRVGWDAHHIVPKAEPRTSAAVAEKYAYACLYFDNGDPYAGLGPNHWRNGVWLRGYRLAEGTRRYARLSERLQQRAYHPTLHSDTYYHSVSDQLHGALRPTDFQCDLGAARATWQSLRGDLEHNLVTFQPADTGEVNRDDF
jgi:hypothetical protein